MVPVHEGRSSQSFPKNPEGQFCDQRESNPSDQIVYQETNHNLIREANHNHNLLAIQWEGTADVLYDCTLCDHCVCHDPLHQHKDTALCVFRRVDRAGGGAHLFAVLFECFECGGVAAVPGIAHRRQAKDGHGLTMMMMTFFTDTCCVVYMYVCM